MTQTTTTKTTTPKPKNAKPATGRKMTKKAEAAALKHKNRHPFQGRCDPDGAPTMTDNKDGTLRIEAFGRHAQAERAAFMIDAADWQRIVVTYGPAWVVVPNGTRGFYLGSGRRQATADIVQQPKGKPTVAVLARLIVGAAAGEVVTYRDGNWRNLCRSNLLVLPKAEAARRRALYRQAQFQAEACRRFPEIMKMVAGADNAANPSAAAAQMMSDIASPSAGSTNPQRRQDAHAAA